MDNELPKWTESRILTDDPTREMPYTDREDPTLKKLRTEKALPSSFESNMDRELPIRHIP
jgi:hypothetical protein